MLNESIIGELDCSREIDFFNLFSDDNLMDLILIDSSAYFIEKFYKNADLTKFTPNSYVYFYEKYGLTKQQLKGYIAAILYMGLEPKKHIEYYWTEDTFNYNNFLPRYLTKNFFFICLHAFSSKLAKMKAMIQGKR